MSGKVRKAYNEGRTFQNALMDEYFFVEHYSKPVCLICRLIIVICAVYCVYRRKVLQSARYLICEDLTLLQKKFAYSCCIYTDGNRFNASSLFLCHCCTFIILLYFVDIYCVDGAKIEDVSTSKGGGWNV